MNEKHLSGKQTMDWLKFAMKVWTSRILIMKACGIGVVVGMIIALGIPKEYTASTFVAHEGTRRRSYQDISALAVMMGDKNSSIATERDALYPSLYFAIVTSPPFLLPLFDLEVHMQGGSTAMTLAQYLKEHQKSPWWSMITSAPFRLAGWCVSLFKGKMEVEEKEKGKQSGPLRLTREEAAIAGAIASRINILIDQKKRAITIDVTMQDPLVAAIVADTVQARLKAYMTEYRKSKARRILEYSEKVCKEAQAEYYASQEKYTLYADSNRDLRKLASRAELARLRNEMGLALEAYNQAELQVQAAEARVKKETPVYAVIRPVQVPLAPSGPHTMRILFVCFFLSGAGCIGWILFGKDFLIKLKKKETTPKGREKADD